MLGIYKDIKNYIYVRNCFKLLCQDLMIVKKYQPKMTKFGVLYFFYKIDRSIDEEYHKDVLSQNLMVIDEVLTSMALVGLIEYKQRYISVDEEEKNFVYLIKFVPVFNYISFNYILINVLILIILIVAFIKFDLLKLIGL